MKYFQRLNKFAPLILRFGLAFVFIWFGTNQLQDAARWVSFLPDWVSALPISQIHLIYANGIFEIIAAILLLLGVRTNIVALLLSIHLFIIASSIGFSATGVRDMGLAVAALTLSLLGAGPFSVDSHSHELPIPEK